MAKRKGCEGDPDKPNSFSGIRRNFELSLSYIEFPQTISDNLKIMFENRIKILFSFDQSRTYFTETKTS
jgi:hypothetical protein